MHAASSTRAASGLRPGPLGVPARSWLTTAARSSDCRKTGKRGPMPNKHRIWRAERRPPYPATDAEAIGLRFSARHPLQAPDAACVAERNSHVCCYEGHKLPALPSCLRRSEAPVETSGFSASASASRRQVWESTRASSARGEGLAAVPRQTKNHPSPFLPCDLRRAFDALSLRYLSAMLAQDRGRKPSPARGEGGLNSAPLIDPPGDCLSPLGLFPANL